ncbi:MAG: hypothetical protein ACFFDS_00170 [Candidatus Thorarchaeota archaeon]
MTEEEKPVISKFMIILAFVSPFLFSICGMLIAYFTTRKSSSTVQKIALVVATSIGLFLAIGTIFALQKIINRRTKTARLEE